MLVNDFFVRIMDSAGDKEILFLSRVLFYNINRLKDRDKFLKSAGISQADYLKFLEALGRPEDIPTLRETLKQILINGADKIAEKFANK